MKRIVVMSGKGGTGKTTVTAALAQIAGSSVLVADCDVDAANLHLLLRPERIREERFVGGQLPMIDTRGCSNCGLCANACVFEAIRYRDGRMVVDPLACEGCGVCRHACPEDRISMHPRVTGMSYVSETRFGHAMVHARLGIGQENSGKLVAHVSETAAALAAEKGRETVLVDGPPGIGCPAISALSGASEVLVVTEATRAGLHDLGRLLTLLAQFRLPSACIINKADLDARTRDAIHALCGERGIPVLAEFPLSALFPESLRRGRTLLEMEDHTIAAALHGVWEHYQHNGEGQ